MAEFSTPDFSVPPLAAGQPGLPALELPDPARPDPPAAALLQPAAPAALELPNPRQPDPPVPDLIDPVMPPDLLRFPPATTHSLGDRPQIAPALAEPPAQLAPATSQLAHNSADAKQLPPELHYDETRTVQDGMTSRLRHLAPLLLLLQGHSSDRGLSWSPPADKQQEGHHDG
jgi:hypothetical protein